VQESPYTVKNRKVQFITNTSYFDPSTREISEFVRQLSQKRRFKLAIFSKNSMIIALAVLSHYTHVTNRQTDDRHMMKQPNVALQRSVTDQCSNFMRYLKYVEFSGFVLYVECRYMFEINAYWLIEYSVITHIVHRTCDKADLWCIGVGPRGKILGRHGKAWRCRSCRREPWYYKTGVRSSVDVERPPRPLNSLHNRSVLERTGWFASGRSAHVQWPAPRRRRTEPGSTPTDSTHDRMLVQTWVYCLKHTDIIHVSRKIGCDATIIVRMSFSALSKT